MRFIATLLLIIALFNASTFAVQNTPTDIGNFLIGFATGMEITLNENAQSCLNDVTTTVDEFTTSFGLIESGLKKKSIAQVGLGIQDFGLAVQEIPTAYQQCGITQFVSEIEAIAAKLSSGVDGIVDIILKESVEIWENKVDLSAEFKAAIADFKSGNFNGSGQNAGEIIGLLLKA